MTLNPNPTAFRFGPSRLLPFATEPSLFIDCGADSRDWVEITFFPDGDGGDPRIGIFAKGVVLTPDSALAFLREAAAKVEAYKETMEPKP